MLVLEVRVLPVWEVDLVVRMARILVVRWAL